MATGNRRHFVFRHRHLQYRYRIWCDPTVCATRLPVVGAQAATGSNALPCARAATKKLNRYGA